MRLGKVLLNIKCEILLKFTYSVRELCKVCRRENVLAMSLQSVQISFQQWLSGA